jgi:aminoglycoside phosphotransferase (APT) family kinase protein
MELYELQPRIERFIRTKLDDQSATVTGLGPGGGHAGFSYLFTANRSAGSNRYFLRLPPPNVKWEGTADVLRQATILRALDGTDVPHARVLWSGDDLEWFDCPYLVQEFVEGSVIQADTFTDLTPETAQRMARQSMAALAGIHRLDQASCAYLGEFTGFEFDVTRWDRFYERAAEQGQLAKQPEVRRLLLEKTPHDARIGVYHGDFQWANLMFLPDGTLSAVIDFELCGIGATLNDVGWICAFNDPAAWPADRSPRMPHGDELEAMYREAWGGALPDVRWFRALAMYKFSIISGFNLMLHRRGKRDDPHWEEMIPSMKANMDYAYQMLRS